MLVYLSPPRFPFQKAPLRSTPMGTVIAEDRTVVSTCCTRLSMSACTCDLLRLWSLWANFHVASISLQDFYKHTYIRPCMPSNHTNRIPVPAAQFFPIFQSQVPELEELKMKIKNIKVRILLILSRPATKSPRVLSLAQYMRVHQA